MCMITFVPAGVVPGTEQFESIETRTDDAHWINDDGHGFMIATPDGVWSKKGMSYVDIFADYVTALTVARARYGSVPSAFHSRIGTAGPNDQTLCHPFTLGDLEPLVIWTSPDEDDLIVNVSTTAMMHNGILPGQYQPRINNRTDSDTSLYVRDVLPIYVNAKTGVPGRRAAARMASIIGTGNKFLVFGAVGGKARVRLINSDSGTWEDDGAWYSSQYYSPRSTFGRYGSFGAGARVWSGSNGTYGTTDLGDPPQDKRAAEDDRPDDITLMESSIYPGWYRRPQDPMGPYWLGQTLGMDPEASAPWRSNRKSKGLPCSCGSKDWGVKNYCSVCGECGDCSESVVLCSCLSEGNKPEYAWEAWSAFYAETHNM